MKKVFVGLSGGVDSSVTALLLQRQGYEVVGVYMKNWTQDLPGIKCPWQEDYQDAKRVAVQLGIEFKMYDFEKDYKQRVVDYMLREYQAGHTPNPDIMCNQEVKFKLFLETALADGADLIATGHYARTKGGKLYTAKDANKDQTYFLYRVGGEALKKTIFPLGGLSKPQVRRLAKQHELVTADKKDSMGICFVGKVGIKDFLLQYVKPKTGKIISQKGQVLGSHDGAIFYTIGQRHGLDVGGGLPYYVTGKDMKKNEVYVTTDLQDKNLWSSELKLADIFWINNEPKSLETRASRHEPKNSQLAATGSRLYVRTRHRAKLVPVKKLDLLSNSRATAELNDEVRALTPGQSAVFYWGELCLGGGILV